MAGAQTSDPVVMTVNGQNVTRSEFEYSYNKNNGDDVIEKTTVEQYVPLFVNYKLKVAAALDARLDTLASFKVEFAKYRDLTFLLTFIVQLWMYATPVIYPLSTIENPKLKLLMQANPLTSIMETFKFGMLGVGEFSWAALGYSAGFAALLLALGVVVFNKIQRTFMDTV